MAFMDLMSTKGKTDPKKVSPESAVKRSAGTWGVRNRMTVRGVFYKISLEG